MPALAHEHEHCLAARLRPHALSHQAAESLVTHPHVDGLERDVNRQFWLITSLAEGLPCSQSRRRARPVSGGKNHTCVAGGGLTVHAPTGRRPLPAGQARRLFEEVQKLPRRQQQKVLDVVSAIVEQFKRKAS